MSSRHSSSRSVQVGPLRENCYIVEYEFDGIPSCLIIDPGAESSRIIERIGIQPSYIVLTHAHFDHIGAVNELMKTYPQAKLAVGCNENTDPETALMTVAKALGPVISNHLRKNGTMNLCPADILLEEGDTVGPFEVISTPGHTSGSICLLDRLSKVLYSGDTLFLHGYGRTDIGGNEKELFLSLEKLMSLDDDTVVYPGHGESTTIGLEKSWLSF